MADIINGQIVGFEQIRYNCGIGGFGNCYHRYTYRVRRFGKVLLITFTNDSQKGWTEERVCPEDWILNAAGRGAFIPDFRQNQDLWSRLAKQAYLSGAGIGNGETALASKYLEDNSTVLTAALLDASTQPVANTGGGTGTGTGTGNGGTDKKDETKDNGLTLDQVLPYIAGGIVLIGIVLIIALSGRR